MEKIYMDVKNDFSYVVAMGASTGGKDSVHRILKVLNKNFSPILLVQHLPPEYISSYVSFMNRISELDVIEAKDGDEVKRGTVLVATGFHQMRLVKRNNKLVVSCREEGYYKGDCPSIDILFDSVSEVMKNKSIGVVLSGTGSDGADSIYKMRKNGAFTICQSENTSIAYEMPKNAFEIGGIVKQVDLNEIPNEINYFIKRNEYKESEIRRKNYNNSKFKSKVYEAGSRIKYSFAKKVPSNM